MTMRALIVLSALALVAGPAAASAVPCCCGSHALEQIAQDDHARGCCSEKQPAQEPECGCMHDSGNAEPAQPAVEAPVKSTPAPALAVTTPPHAYTPGRPDTVTSPRYAGGPPLYLAISSLRL
jgi:hypothetical protein